MDKPIPDVKMQSFLDQILSELATVEEGMTVREICKTFGLPTTKTNLSRVAVKVADLVALGQVEYVGKKRSASVDGTIRPVQAYGLVQGGEGGEQVYDRITDLNGR